MLTVSTLEEHCRMCGGQVDVLVRYDLARFQPAWQEQPEIDTTVEIARCRNHGSFLTHRVPTAQQLGSQYQRGSQTEYYADPARAPARRTQRLLNQLQKSVKAGSRVVDVGGGDGAFALVAKRAGYASWLQEIGKLDTDKLDAAGVPLVRTFGPEHDATFDAVTLWDVYEHVWPHDAFLAPLHRVLRPGGRLLIEVPSPSRLVWPLLMMGLMTPSPRREAVWGHIVSFTHVQLMTPAELRATLPALGFKVVDVQTFADLAYKGAEYARRLLPPTAANVVGRVFDDPTWRRRLMGANKTFLVAEKV